MLKILAAAEEQTLSKYTCVTCKKKTTGHGNSAQPFANGRCCDNCNIQVVVPEKFRDLNDDWEEC